MLFGGLMSGFGGGGGRRFFFFGFFLDIDVRMRIGRLG